MTKVFLLLQKISPSPVIVLQQERPYIHTVSATCPKHLSHNFFFSLFFSLLKMHHKTALAYQMKSTLTFRSEPGLHSYEGNLGWPPTRRTTPRLPSRRGFSCLQAGDNPSLLQRGNPSPPSLVMRSPKGGGLPTHDLVCLIVTLFIDTTNQCNNHASMPL